MRRTGTADQDQNKLEKYLSEYLQQLDGFLLADGRQLDAVRLTAGQQNVVQHGLDRPLRGYQIVLKSATTDVWDDQASNLLSAKTLLLRTTNDCVVSLWVY